MKTKRKFSAYQPKTPQSPFDRALKYLSFRPRSTKEMHDYLTKKGYSEEDINEALIRYKPTPDENATPRQASNTNAYSDFEKRDNDKMSRTQKPLEPLINKDCRGVADKSDMAHPQTIIDDVEVF